MTPRIAAPLLLALALTVLAVPLNAEGQETRKAARIGLLVASAPPYPFLDTFKQGLRELGYVEGRNISFEIRWGEGKEERLPRLAAELVGLNVDVIVASSQAAVAAKQATTTIPIVMPIITAKSSLCAMNSWVPSIGSIIQTRSRSSLAGVGGNSSLSTASSGKRREISPTM